MSEYAAPAHKYDIAKALEQLDRFDEAVSMTENERYFWTHVATAPPEIEPLLHFDIEGRIKQEQQDKLLGGWVKMTRRTQEDALSTDTAMNRRNRV